MPRIACSVHARLLCHSGCRAGAVWRRRSPGVEKPDRIRPDAPLALRPGHARVAPGRVGCSQCDLPGYSVMEFRGSAVKHATQARDCQRGTVPGMQYLSWGMSPGLNPIVAPPFLPLRSDNHPLETRGAPFFGVRRRRLWTVTENWRGNAEIRMALSFPAVHPPSKIGDRASS